MANLRDTIADILNIPNTDSWQIVDSQPPLYMINYTPDANMLTYGSIRGLIVDIQGRTIISRTAGYTPTVTTSSVSINDDDGSIQLEDAFNPNLSYTLDPKTTLFQPSFDGPVLRLFLYNGVVHYASDDRLDAQWSRVGTSYNGSSPTILEAFNELKGDISEDTFFDTTKRYSPYVHSFIIAHPAFQVVSKIPVGVGYLISLETKKMWEVNDSPYPLDEIDTEVHGLNTHSDFIANPQTPGLYTMPMFRLEDVNDFLEYGFYEKFDNSGLSDVRLFPGEAVIAVLHDDVVTGIPRQDYGKVKGHIRINSPSYQWRSNLRDGNPHLYYQFYLLTNGKFIRAEFANEEELYNQKFPLLSPVTKEEIQDLSSDAPLVVWPELEMTTEQRRQILDTVDGRLYNIWLSFFYALPPSQQDIVLDFYNLYLDNIADVKDWLIQLNRNNDLAHEVIPPRAKQIIALARGFTRDRINKGLDQPYMATVESEIVSLVDQEEANSLYRIVLAMRCENS